MKVQHFFEPRTSTLTYVVHDERNKIGVRICRKVDSNTLLSTICGIFYDLSFQYMV